MPRKAAAASADVPVAADAENASTAATTAEPRRSSRIKEQPKASVPPPKSRAKGGISARGRKRKADEVVKEDDAVEPGTKGNSSEKERDEGEAKIEETNGGAQVKEKGDKPASKRAKPASKPPSAAAPSTKPVSKSNNANKPSSKVSNKPASKASAKPPSSRGASRKPASKAKPEEKENDVGDKQATIPEDPEGEAAAESAED